MPKLIMAPWHFEWSSLKMEQTYREDKCFVERHIQIWMEFLRKTGANNFVLNSVSEVAQKKTKTILSGQQIGIGISPYLTLFKIFSIECLARKLEDKFGVKHRAVFWLQTEDHDLEEVLKFGYFKNNNSYDELNYENHFKEFVRPLDIRRSVGLLLAERFSNELLKPLLGQFGQLEILEQFQQAYKNSTFSEGFTKLYYEIFPESKVLLFDINQEGLADLKTELLRESLVQADNINSLLEEQRKVLAKEGKKTPVKLRLNSPLFFYHPQSIGGPRYRLQNEGGGFFIPEIELFLSRDTLLKEIEEKPEKFSTSALLRPLLQDKIFDVTAYVGGPAEISYLAQIDPLYEHFKIKMPARIPRPIGGIINDKSYKSFVTYFKQDHLHESKKDFEQQILEKSLPKESQASFILSKIDTHHVNELESILNEMVKLDKSLTKPRNKTLRTIKNALEKFLKKYEAALFRQQISLDVRKEKLIQQLWPNNIPQERQISSLSLGISYGTSVYREIFQQFSDWFNEQLAEGSKSNEQ